MESPCEWRAEQEIARQRAEEERARRLREEEERRREEQRVDFLAGLLARRREHAELGELLDRLGEPGGEFAAWARRRWQELADQLSPEAVEAESTGQRLFRALEDSNPA